MHLFLLKQVILLIASLFILIEAADIFTNTSAKLGRFLKIPPFIIGAAIISLGTSLPEIASGLFAVAEGTSEFVAGSVIGSNITNILLILGLVAVVSGTLKTSFELVKIDLPFLVGSALLLVAIAFDGKIVLLEALLALFGMGAYLSYTLSSRKVSFLNLFQKREEFSRYDWFGLLVPPVFIYYGAQYTLESTIRLAQSLSLGPDILAATAVALGTSLPELATALVAARGGHSEMAIGIVLGSNIINSFAVIGLAGLLGTITVSQTLLFFGLPIMLAATLFYFFITQDREVTAWEGIILLLLYLAFVLKIAGVV